MKVMKELILTEARMFLREPVAVFFTLLFPFIPFLLFGTMYGHHEAMPGFRVIDFHVPAIVAMVIGYLGLMSIPIALSQYREEGVLKRFRASPLSLGRFLVAHIFVQLVLFVIVAAAVVIVGELVFDVRFAGSPALVALAGLLSILCMFTMGFALIGFFRGPRTAQAGSAFVFFLMLFTSGAAMPRRDFPPWLQEVTDLVPLAHVVDTVTTAWVGLPASDEVGSYVTLAVLTVVCFVVAKLTFRWQ